MYGKHDANYDGEKRFCSQEGDRGKQKSHTLNKHIIIASCHTVVIFRSLGDRVLAFVESGQRSGTVGGFVDCSCKYRVSHRVVETDVYSLSGH